MISKPDSYACRCQWSFADNYSNGSGFTSNSIDFVYLYIIIIDFIHGQ